MQRTPACPRIVKWVSYAVSSYYLSLLRYLSFWKFALQTVAKHLNHWGKWVQSVKFETENELFCTKFRRLKNDKKRMFTLNSQCVCHLIGINSRYMHQLRAISLIGTQIRLRYHSDKLELTQVLLRQYEQNIAYRGLWSYEQYLII